MSNTDMIIAELGKVAPSQHKVNDDFEFARQNLIDILTHTNATIAEVQQLADQSQAPKFYEILNQLYKQAADSNEKLLILQERIANLNKSEGNKPPPAQNITNNLVMTTEQVRQMIMKDMARDGNGNI
jgi:hypothetical protein